MITKFNTSQSNSGGTGNNNGFPIFKLLLFAGALYLGYRFLTSQKPKEDERENN